MLIFSVFQHVRAAQADEQGPSGRRTMTRSRDALSSGCPEACTQTSWVQSTRTQPHGENTGDKTATGAFPCIACP